jgi:TonB family protein
MSAAPSLAPDAAQRRAFPRHPLHVSIDVLALRSGVPEHLPGRCIDLSETGVGAIVAGQLVAQQQVAVELQLPGVRMPMRVLARVRHMEQLRCGLQFVALPVEQREMIRYWVYRAASQRAHDSKEGKTSKTDSVPAAAATEPRPRRIRFRLRQFYALAALTVLFAGLTWWQWQRSWSELEAQASFTAPAGSPRRVSPEIIEKRIMYKTIPVYPEAARLANKQGLVVLDVVINTDGTVRRVREVSGPDLLAESAADALEFWKFEPYLVDGRPVEVESTIAIEFRLN